MSPALPNKEIARINPKTLKLEKVKGLAKSDKMVIWVVFKNTNN